MKKLMQKVRSESGFTLIELLGVGVILTIMAIIAVPTVMGSINKARVNTATDSALQIASALQRWKAASISIDNNTGNFPVSTTREDSEGDFTTLIGNDYWQRPANANYTWYGYITDPGGTPRFRLCVQALDSRNTIIRVTEDNTVSTSTDVANIATYCAMPTP